MCTSLFGVLSFNCKGEDAKSNKINISLDVLNSKVSSTIAENKQNSKTSSVYVQNQTVGINGYPAFGNPPDIRIAQRMNLNIISRSDIDSKITSDDMSTLATSVGSQFDDLLSRTGDSFLNNNKNNIINLKNAIVNVINDSKTLKNVQDSLTDTVAVQGQNVTINFAPGIPESFLKEYAQFIKPGETASSRPYIEINQEMANNIITTTAMKSVISNITKNSTVNTILSGFGNKDCELEFTQDDCPSTGTSAGRTNLRAKIKTQSEKSGKKCLNVAEEKYPTLTWQTDSKDNTYLIARTSCTYGDDTNQQEQPAPVIPGNCVMSTWSPWTQCDKSCGGGQQTRSRTIQTPAAAGGACPDAANRKETKSCNTQLCQDNNTPEEEKSDIEKQIEQNIINNIQEQQQQQDQRQQQEQQQQQDRRAPVTPPVNPPNNPVNPPVTPPPVVPTANDNKMMYIGGGVGVLLLILIMFVVMKKK